MENKLKKIAAFRENYNMILSIIMLVIIEIISIVAMIQILSSKNEKVLFWTLLIANIPVLISLIFDIVTRDVDNGFVIKSLILLQTGILCWLIAVDISEDKKVQAAQPVYEVMCEEASNYDTGFYVKDLDGYSCFVTVNNGVVVDNFDVWFCRWESRGARFPQDIQNYLRKKDYSLEDYRIVKITENTFFYEIRRETSLLASIGGLPSFDTPRV